MLTDKESYKNINRTIDEAVIQYNRKNTKASRGLFLAVLDEDPSNPEANYYLGLMYSKENDWGKAVVHFKNVVDHKVNFLYTQQCRMLLGYIYFKNKEYKRAEHEYEEVLKTNMDIVQAYAALAAIKYYLDEKLEAIKFAEKACNIDNYNLNAKNTYGFLLCDLEVDIPKGLEMLREVVRIKPHNPAYLDSLGWAYHKKGDRPAAIASLKKALEEDPKNQEIKDHIEIVYKNK